MLCSILIVFMSVLGIGPVLVCMRNRPMFVPVTVVDGLRLPWKMVIVMTVVVMMPVLMGNRLVMVQVMVFFEEQ
jgi:hypothetical protein